MIYDNVLAAMGHTALVRLSRLTGPEDGEILVKYEGQNVGGSIKTRTALKMIEEAEKRGDIGPGSIVVEPTSGNQGIGLALVCAVKGYDCIIVMPDSVSHERRFLVKQYGAKVKLVHDDGDIGKCIRACMETAKAMAAENPKVYIPNQFENRDNLRAHVEHTAPEILAALEESGVEGIDAFCSGVGTGGTISGIGAVLKERFPEIKIAVVEPENAAILSGGNIGTHLQMGIGDGLIPDILNTDIYDEIRIVSDEEAIRTTKALARKEGILCGISSGTNVAVALQLARELGKGRRVLTVLPDTGERYFSTPLFEDSGIGCEED